MDTSGPPVKGSRDAVVKVLGSVGLSKGKAAWLASACMLLAYWLLGVYYYQKLVLMVLWM